jgi:thiosulfate dehydrogenase
MKQLRRNIVSNLAGYIKNNMPYLQTSHQKQQLSNEQSWDVAAYINSKPRPHMNQSILKK